MRRGWLGQAHTSSKERPVLILDLRGDDAVVICGTSTAGRDLPCVTIDNKERAGRVLQLRNPTHFYVTNIERLKIAAIDARGPCTHKIILDVDEMITAWLRDVYQARKYAGVIELTDDGPRLPIDP